MGRTHRALLIGVGHAPAADGLLEPLDEPVEADLRLMASVLGGVGYEVETLRDPDLDLVRTKLYEAGTDVPADGTLLLYFTGHGIRAGGNDYLVPVNARPPRDGGWREPYLSSLLPANISPLLNECKAGTVLWLIDACRTDLGEGEAAFGNGIDNGPPHGGFAVLTACSAGEHSGYTSEGSFFTRGLADALGPLTPARTVEEVFDLARARAAAAARRHGLTQTARIRYGTNGEAATRTTEICEGRPLLDTWLRAARESPLWVRTREADRALVPGVQERVAAFVEQCARTLHLAQGRLPRADPWSDEGFPARMVGRLLPAVLPENEPLSVVETAFLVAAPFLREAAWAERLSQSVEIDPYRPGREPGADAHRRHFEQISDQHTRMVRKAAQCRARDRTEDETAVTMWLVHRWIADRFETDDEPVPQGMAEKLITALGVTPGRVHEVAEMLCAAASAVGLDELPDDPPGRAPAKVVLPDGPRPLRIRPLSGLLRLAAVLAVDVRTFPEIAAEHLAVTDPVLPEHVVAIAHALRWEREDSALDLDAPCPHQAVHAALAEIAEEADQLVAHLLDRAAGLPGTEAGLMSAVPKRVTARALRPARTGGGHESYDVPLLRFHLSQSEVRELLMGEQLYDGDPTLALRELYQNAMDACRYRAMRWKYLTSSGAQPAGWNGRITFTQGEDERGRYVECRDNGVGMSADLLTHTFTRAGSRFERSKAFRQEQSRWLRHDRTLRLYPNSRFGIGVFSYFMLADEITIVTRHVSPDGIPADHALRVDIPSSASLFRIRRHSGADDGLPEGGTRVRLYLRDATVTEKLSCTRVLRSLVRFSEFALETLGGEGSGHRWEPGELQPPVDSGAHAALQAVPGVLWWVDGEGAILCDGVATDQRPFGYVLNLTGPHAGRLSVSRTELQDFDHGWAEEQWRLGADVLSSWSGLTMRWTADLERQSLRVAQVLDEVWRGRNVTIAEEENEDKRHSLDEIGWFHPDAEQYRRTEHRRVRSWRKAVMGRSVWSSGAAPPRSTAGHPVPSPGDADVAITPFPSWHDVVAYAAEKQVPLAGLLHRMRRLRVLGPGFAPPALRGDDGLGRVPSPADAALAATLSGKAENPSSILVRTATAQSRFDDLAGLVLASQWLNAPLGELAESLARLAPLHGLAVPVPPEHLAHHVCTQADIDLLFVKARGYREVRRAASPLDVRLVSRLTDTPVTDVLARMTEYAWLGWVPPTPAEMALWAALDEEGGLVPELYLTRLPDGRTRLDWAATVHAAELLETSLTEAEQRLAGIATTLGLEHTRRYGDGRLDGSLVPSAEAGALVEYLVRDQYVDFDRGLSLIDLNFADDEVTEEHLGVLRDLGFSLPEGHRIGRAWHTLDLRTRYVFSGRDLGVDDNDFPAEHLTEAVWVNAAMYLQESLKEVWALAARHAPSFGFGIPPLPPALADRRPSTQLCDALITYDAHGDTTPRWTPLTAAALVRYARRFALTPVAAYEQLSAFRPLGALVPLLGADDLAALPDSVPDEWDVAALSPDQRVSDSDGPYTPLDLVSIAARLGESVTETARRITPYRPLFPAPTALPAAPCADVVPRWQDLALLSQYFDGRLPSVAGTVSRQHVARAAEATGEHPDWVRGRLLLYADMFGLVVPVAEDDGQEENADD
ncbi:caspase family protein [Streptomyces sp. NPDC058794]|uniref:HD domain-containing protein n=1 Tax=Streptomyces sp. NPDC058794 TaxID=3346636 RepID=UPI0036AD55E3